MKLKPTRHSSSPTGFTMVELLVVIGILAVLAGLVLPAVARAKHKALATQCINNSKQVAGAILLFAGDNSQTFPFALYKPAGDTGPVLGFDDFIYSYLGQQLTDAEKFSHYIPLAKRSRLLTCPADKVPPSKSGPDIWRRTYSMPEANMVSINGGSPLRNMANGGIGVYYSTFWGPFPPADPAQHLAASENVVQNPSQTLALAERPHPGNWAGNDHYAVTRSTGDQMACFTSQSLAMDYHGGGRFVYSYCDGHVIQQKREQTWGNSGSDAAWAGDWTLRTDD